MRDILRAIVTLAPGTVFANDFEVVRELSAGGMGTLYVVLQRSTGKQRALKLMLPTLVADPTLRRRFEQEAKVAALIESDHVVEVLGAGIDPATGSPWLAMELLRGEELTPQAILGAPGPLTVLQVVMRQICHAVGAAHRAGIVHRDLKPANVFLAESKRAGETRTVKVLDFGIAKIVADASATHTMAMGSPTWMAPEQSEKGPITPAADVWALGLIAYHLLTDKLFWRAAQDPDGTVAQVMKEVLLDPIPLASQRAAEQGAPPLPPWFDAWFSHCVVRQAALRYRDAGEAFAALERAIGGGHISLLPPSVSPMTTPMAPPTRTPSGYPSTHTPTGPLAPVAPVPPGQTQVQGQAGAPMGVQPAGVQPTLRAIEPSPAIEPPRKGRWLVPLFGVVAVSAVVAFAWLNRYGQKHVEPPKPVAEVPSATAEILEDDEEIDPATPLDVDAGAKPKKKVQPARSAGPAGPSLSAALEQLASAEPPPPPHEPKNHFDRAGAQLALRTTDLSRCAIADGPRGESRLGVLYGNDGVPKRFFFNRPYAGTPVEICIQTLMRKAKVEPFTGLPQMVTTVIDIK